MHPTSTSGSKTILSKYRRFNIFMTWGTIGFSTYTAEIWILRLCHVKPCFFTFLTGTQHNSAGFLHQFVLQESTDSSISAWPESLPDPECIQPRFDSESTTHFTNVMWLCWCFLLQWICRISYKRSLFQIISD